MLQKGISPPPRQGAFQTLKDAIGYFMELDRWFQRLYGVFPKVEVYAVALNPAAVSANAIEEQTFTVSGLTTLDHVSVNKPSLTAGVGIVNARVSAADTLAITFINNTGAPVDPGSETYTIVSTRR